MFFKMHTFICCLVIPLTAIFVDLILLFNKTLLMVTSFLVICTSDIPSQCSLNFGMQVVLQESFSLVSISMCFFPCHGSKVVCCFSFPTFCSQLPFQFTEEGHTLIHHEYFYCVLPWERRQKTSRVSGKRHNLHYQCQ